jgi:hypothetical protein
VADGQVHALPEEAVSHEGGRTSVPGARGDGRGQRQPIPGGHRGSGPRFPVGGLRQGPVLAETLAEGGGGGGKDARQGGRVHQEEEHGEWTFPILFIPVTVFYQPARRPGKE